MPHPAMQILLMGEFSLSHGKPAVDGEFDLIVTIINKGWADEIVEAARSAGAEAAPCSMGGAPECMSARPSSEY